MTARRERGFLLAWVAVLALGVGLIWPGRSLEAQDVAPGTAQNGSIQGTTSATCSVYHATGGAIVVAGTWVGTLQFESTVDGTNYLALPVTPQAGGAAVTTTAANGTWSFTNAGYTSPAGVRVRASAWTSGTATINCTTVGASYFLANGNTVTALGPLSLPLTWAASGGTADTGISRTAAGTLAVGNGTQGDLTGTVRAATFISSGEFQAGTNFLAPTAGAFYWSSKTLIKAPADGSVTFTNQAATIGSQIKADALPTVASGFGGSPTITAGSTAFAGSVNVGTGGAATSGVVNFNGTAFPSAPFCVATNSVSHASPSQAASTTTQLTLFAATAWPANSIISWICVSSK